jgi:hypothetical protein
MSHQINIKKLRVIYVAIQLYDIIKQTHKPDQLQINSGMEHILENRDIIRQFLMDSTIIQTEKKDLNKIKGITEIDFEIVIYHPFDTKFFSLNITLNKYYSGGIAFECRFIRVPWWANQSGWTEDRLQEIDYFLKNTWFYYNDDLILSYENKVHELYEKFLSDMRLELQKMIRRVMGIK